MSESRILAILWSATDHLPYDDLIPESWIFGGQSEEGLTHYMEDLKGALFPAKCDLIFKKYLVTLDYSGKNKKFNEENDVYIGCITIRLNSKNGQVEQILWHERQSDDLSKAFNLPFEWRNLPFDEAEENEGGIKLGAHKSYERNSKLRIKKINHALKHSGVLQCEVCRFDFSATYGSELGTGFCEVHHKVPLSQTGIILNKLSDLAILCSNCHRMIHRSSNILGNMLKTEELRKIVMKRSKPKK